MSQNYPSIVGALGSVTGATGVAVWSAGVATARTAKGTYTLTTDQGMDATQCEVQATLRGATAGMIAVAQTSDTVKTVSTFDAAGAAADLDFDFEIKKAPLS